MAAITGTLLVALAASLGGPPAAGAEGVVPTQGPWHGTTSAGLPVAFEVSGGEVTGIRFRFRWGFCGTYEAAPSAGSVIEPSGRWTGEDSRGQIIEATFVAPDRAEGTVTSLGRMLPGCPETHASFSAEPGAAPFEQAEAVVRANVVSGRLVSSPAGINLRRNGSLRFYRLRWQNFGEPVARAAGWAFLRHGCRRCRDKVVRRARVVVYLNELTPQGDHRVYLHYRYELRGPIPPGFSRSGGGLLE
ncbi:MAG: hypothetical protein JST31_07330 [Actinobacteria bacterium]|nr:hypothetical protein [Actinomycetota bacterium]